MPNSLHSRTKEKLPIFTHLMGATSESAVRFELTTGFPNSFADCFLNHSDTPTCILFSKFTQTKKREPGRLVGASRFSLSTKLIDLGYEAPINLSRHNCSCKDILLLIVLYLSLFFIFETAFFCCVFLTLIDYFKICQALIVNS